MHATPALVRTSRRPRPRPTAATLVLALVASLLTLVAPAPAAAAVSTPAPGATVSGLVPITEARGGDNNCISGGSEYSRLEVRRVADGAVVHTARRNGEGALSTTWDSVGQANGTYRIRSYVRDARRSGFLNLGCTNQSERLESDLTVTLENGARPTLSLPDTVVTGEPLEVRVTTRVDGRQVTDRTVGGREVTVAVAGGPSQVLTTGADGTGTTVLDLPDLPAGPVTVTASVADDAAFVGRSTSARTRLTERTTATFWQGDTRGTPGRTARLIGQVVDVTPGSDRYGAPLAGVPVTLTLDGFEATATTTASGRALATTVVDGPSRLAPATARFAGDEVYLPSGDEITFVVGDDASLPADEEAGVVGGYTGLLGGLLGGLVGTVGDVVDGVTQPLLGSTTDLLDHLLPGSLGSDLTDVLDLAERGLLHLLPADQLDAALDTLLGEVGRGVDDLGDPVDAVLDRLLDGLGAAGPLGEVVDTARFSWRSVVVTEDGRDAREFGAILGLPEPLDVTGDGVADVLANLTFTTGVGGLDLDPRDGTLGGELALPEDATLVPRLEVARLPGAPATLPLSLQAVVTLPGSDQEIRVGYDTRASDAPEAFRADVAVTDGGAGLELATRSDAPLTVTGALVPAAGDDAASTPGALATGDLDDPGLDEVETGSGVAEQRFGIAFDPAPRDGRLAVALGGAQDLAVSLRTDRPTTVGLQLVDDSGAEDVFVLDGLLDAVDGELAAHVRGHADGGLLAQLRSAGLDRVLLEGREVVAGRTATELLVGLEDVPADVALDVSPDGRGSLDASDAIGTFEAGYATGGRIARLDDAAYLHLLEDADHRSVALRLPGFAGLTLDAGDTVAVDLELAPTPLRALVVTEDLTLDADVRDAPARFGLTLDTAGTVQVRGSAPIDEVSVAATSTDGTFAGASDLDLRLVDVPEQLTVGLEGDAVVFDAGGQPVGLVEVTVADGSPVAVPGGGDGLLVDERPDGTTAIAARITGLRRIEAALSDTPQLLLDTVAEQVFTVELRSPADGGGTDTVRATLDHLVPDLRLALSEDGTGALRVDYTASRPTDRLSFDLGDLTGSIGGPLPAQLSVCFAEDEACLPDAGFDDPSLGSIRFLASEHTTLDLVDAAGGFSAQGLRLRALDLTGELGDDGGDLYLDTTEVGGGCGDTGCVHPIRGGTVRADLDDLEVTFTPGDGFSAVRSTTSLEVDTVFGVPVGLSRSGRTGTVTCVPATDLRVRLTILGIRLNLGLRDAIC